MTRVIMNGCNGKMGQCITEICKNDPEITIVAGIDLYNGIKNDYPVFSSLAKCNVSADVIIDFSNAAAVDELLDYCEKKEIPVVLCTTGLSEEQLAKVDKVAQSTAVLKSANMSLGINTLMELLRKAALVFARRLWNLQNTRYMKNITRPQPVNKAVTRDINVKTAPTMMKTNPLTQYRTNTNKIFVLCAVQMKRAKNLVILLQP